MPLGDRRRSEAHQGFARLRELYLGGTKVTDAGLEHLKDLPELQTLDLSGTEVSDVGLEHLKGLRHLRTLDLSSTRVKGPLDLPTGVARSVDRGPGSNCHRWETWAVGNSTLARISCMVFDRRGATLRENSSNVLLVSAIILARGPQPRPPIQAAGSDLLPGTAGSPVPGRARFRDTTAKAESVPQRLGGRRPARRQRVPCPWPLRTARSPAHRGRFVSWVACGETIRGP